MNAPTPCGDAIPRTRGPLAALLDARGLRLRRRHGQNFLVEPTLAERIVDDAAVTRRDHVVEIGPGAGALTQPLLARAGRVTAVEIDRGLAELLAERLGDRPGFRLVHGDCLDGPGGLHPSIGEALDGARSGEFERTVVVANLPYSIGTEVLVRLLGAAPPPASVTVMLQSEVLARIVARPDTDDYGPLAILASLSADVKTLRRVPPTAFLPRPAVESVVFRVTPRPASPEDRLAASRAVALARIAFTKRRKTLANALAGAVPSEAYARAAIDPAARPETVAPDGWLRLGEATSALDPQEGAARPGAASDS